MKHLSNSIRSCLHPFRKTIALAAATSLFAAPAQAASDTGSGSLLDRIKSLEDDNAHLHALLKHLGIDDTAPEKQDAAAKTTGAKSGDSAPVKLAKGGDDSQTTLVVPDSPSAAILGVSPQKIIRPSTPADLIGAAINGLDEHGNFQSSFAADITPMKFFFNYDPCKYTDENPQHPGSKSSFGNLSWLDYLSRVAGRAQLSLVVAKGATDDDKSLRGAVGLQLTLMDETDECLRPYSFPRGAAFADLKRLGRTRDEALTQKQSGKSSIDDDKKLWHYNSAWSVGAAGSAISEGGDGNDLRSNGYALYSTYLYGFEGTEYRFKSFGKYLQHNDQFLLQFQYRNHDMIPDPSKKGDFLAEDQLKVATRLRFGDRDLNASLDGSFMEERLPGKDFKPAYSLAFDVEKRIFDDTWLSLSMGKEFDHADGNDPLLVIGAVKVGYTTKKNTE